MGSGDPDQAHGGALYVNEVADVVDDGWVPVVDSRELPPGAVVGYEPVTGEPLVVWRTNGGRLVAMDDRCPHQWSSLTAVGVVDGDEIVCTTHFWRFGADGAGCKQSMNGRRDEKDPVPVSECRESDGRVWVRTTR